MRIQKAFDESIRPILRRKMRSERQEGGGIRYTMRTWWEAIEVCRRRWSVNEWARLETIVYSGSITRWCSSAEGRSKKYFNAALSQCKSALPAFRGAGLSAQIQVYALYMRSTLFDLNRFLMEGGMRRSPVKGPNKVQNMT